MNAKCNSHVSRYKFALSSAAPVAIVPTWLACNTLAGCGSVPLATGAGGVLVAAVLVSTITDLRTKKILNLVTYPAIAWALALSAAKSAVGGWTDSLSALTLSEAIPGAAVCFSLMLVVYLHGGCGAGDVKLAPVIGAVLGWQAGINALLLCHLFAGVFCCVLLLRRISIYLVDRGFWYSLIACCWSPCSVAMMIPSTSSVSKALNNPLPMAAFFAAGILFTELGWRLI